MSEQHHSGEQGHSEEAAQMFPTDFTPADIFNEMYADLENLNDLMMSFSNAIVIQVAMDEELAPFLAATEQAQPSFTEGVAKFYPRYLMLEEDQVPLLLVRSKIGLVNAASAVTEAINYATNCLGVISAGTAGGLAQHINVGDIVLGSDYLYTDADATIFGYERGQIPGMPVSYGDRDSDWEEAIEAALSALKSAQEEGSWAVHQGRMLAGNSFVTEYNVKDTREAFDTALSTDMETTAIAQICSNYDVSFMAVRCISDLCGPAADQEFHLSVDVVAPRSARYALQIAAELWTQQELPALDLNLED